MLTVQTPGCSLMHASDVQGPIDDEPLELILRQNPNMLFIGGPPLYLQDFKIDRESLARACENMVKIVGKIPLTIVDHHLLRSLDYEEYLKPVHAKAKRRKHRVLTASEFVGQEPKLLEARRKEFHAQEPVKKEWYERLKLGEFKEGF